MAQENEEGPALKRPARKESNGQGLGALGTASRANGTGDEAPYWSRPLAQVLAGLDATTNGLSEEAAEAALKRFGANTLKARPALSATRLFLRQFESPLILILLFAAIASGFAREWTDATIVIAILLGSGLLGFFQEYRASHALEKLRQRIRAGTSVVRGGAARMIASEEIVPGDVVLLSAGSLVPADGLVLEAKDFFVVQAALTGEPVAVEKFPGTVSAAAGLAERTNCVFMGTTVRSGTARALITRTGPETVFGGISGRLRLRPPETEFERGIRRYGLLLTQVMLALVLVIFAANVFLARPAIEALLFAIALAVGLSPELLPAIVTITLSQGAQKMAASGVIVRRLSAIENLGAMDVLCTDKTGTLTVGVMGLDAALGSGGEPSDPVRRLAYLNAKYQTGLSNPLDDAIIAAAEHANLGPDQTRKIDEIPYDFMRKRLSVVVEDGQAHRMIVKGAFESVLEACDHVRAASEAGTLDAAGRGKLAELFAGWCAQGYRVLGIASKDVGNQAQFARSDEQGLVFEGFLLFMDPLKAGIDEALSRLKSRAVALKIITGDNRLVAAHLAGQLAIASPRILTGREINDLGNDALRYQAARADIFAEVDPNQKERVILALKRAGHVVGYMGDGINDAPALHAADIGISVDQAVDVAKEAADFVLLKQDLNVLSEGIELGRKTFANTLKYISITTSANFGNMISMAIASLFLPFLPLLATQILLNNFLSDLPSLNIASDNVDPELVERPHHWRIGEIRNSMVGFGLISSAFDILTFIVLLEAFRTAPEEFRTAWFVESVLTQLAIIFVIRTRRSLFRSMPARVLAVVAFAVGAFACILPYLPIAGFLGFVPLPASLLGVVVLITATYCAASEILKRFLFKPAASRAR